jgi:hypothetical protein
MNAVEKTSTGVTPAELILNNSIRLSNQILAPVLTNAISQVALSDTMDNWIARQHTLLQVAQAHQHQSDSHLLVEYDPRISEYNTCCSHHLLVEVTNSYPNIADHSK